VTSDLKLRVLPYFPKLIEEGGCMPDQKQIDHEKFTAEKIVSLCGESAVFDRLGDPKRREPDIIFATSFDSLGIEVTTAYYRGDEDDPDLHAREDWKFAKNPTFDECGIHRIIDPKTGKPKIWDRMDERLTASCQIMLTEKCSNQYAGVNHLWLAIYADAPVTESYEFDQIIKNLAIPSVNPFERIFILHTVERGGGYRALQFFPNVCSFFS
jgi:hypothetical protein